MIWLSSQSFGKPLPTSFLQHGSRSFNHLLGLNAPPGDIPPAGKGIDTQLSDTLVL
jgi:hypothetical protein